MSLVTWHPEEALDNFFDTNRLFNVKPNRWYTETETVVPRVNVTENENFFHLEAEAPGMQDKDINIEVHNRVLTIKDHSFADDIETINKLIQTGKIITTVKKRINLN